MIIAVTGGIGSGKSRVSSELANLLDAELLSADTICRDLLSVNAVGWKALQSLAGKKYFFSDGQLDRTKLRKELFTNDAFRRKFDSVLHPLVHAEMITAATTAKVEKKVVFAEVPLLFEKGWQNEYDLSILVFAKSDTCVRRIVLRDNVTEEEAQQAVGIQMPITEKRLLADVIIDNNGNFSQTFQQLLKLKQKMQDFCKKNP